MDYFFQEQRWTDTFLSLHVKKFKRIILFLLIAFSAAGAKAAEVPISWKDVTFNENIRYSQWVINSRIRDFYANQDPRGFNTYYENGTKRADSEGTQKFDYVPGLVAKAILEAYANYSTFDWSKPWFYSVMNYAKEKTYTLVAKSGVTDFSKITLDNMNACKMYFPLMETGALSDGAKSTGETAIANVLTDMKKYNELYVIGNGSESGVKNSTNETVQSMFGGWFHKPSYKDQMWCDGLYMGAALLSQIVNYKNSDKNVDGTSDWDLITKQFTISWNQLYNTNTKGLLYHAFTANPKDNASSAWAGISNTSGSEVYHSAAFWGRAMGWYFLALVDVLEQMKLAGLASESNDNHSYYTTLTGYLEKLALGLAKYQDDASGCWYQVVDQKDEALTGNYLESSCTSLFAAAYLKAVRLGFLTSNGTYNYKTIGVNAFKGAVNQFMKYDTFEPTGTTVQLVHNCASAGLGGDKKRSGSREYYITGNDVGQTNTYTEGKVMGAFIMAATEYELANPKAIRFSYDLAPTYTLAKGGSIKAEALGSGTITYKWYKSDNSEVSGATSETFTPAESGTYYCKATNGSTEIKTSTTAVTVEAVGNGNGGSNGEKVLFSTDFTEEAWTGVTTTSQTTSTPAMINGTQVTLKGFANKTGFSVSNGTMTFPGNNMSDKNYYIAIPVSGVNGSITIEFGGTDDYTYYYDICTKDGTPSRTETEKVANGVVTITESYSGTDAIIYIGRSSSNYKTISSIKITTPSSSESDSRATFTYNEEEITFSEKTAGDKSVYTTTLEIGASKAGKPITITPKTQNGATIKQDETIVNGNITITAPSTIGQTTTSTYTVTSKDGTSTTKYEINVKLVKENVVLVYAQSDGKTEWTWDKTANSTKPTFTNPTLKVYLANADGTKSDQEVTNVTGIKYKSDVTDVATVNETTGAITIQENANGGAKIYAILKDNGYYNDAQTFFNILVKQGYSYSVADDETIKNGPSLNQSVYIKNGDTKLVKMTFGGWKWSTSKDENGKLISTYKVNEKERKDEWNARSTSDESAIASIDGYKTSISGAQDAVDESKEASEDVIYGSTRYGWFKPAKKRSDGYLETYPYSLPVRGAYMTFEPTQNGTLTVYILQNGAWNTNRSGEYKGIKFNNGEIVAGEFRPHSFYICNQRGLNVDQFSPKTFTCTTKQKVQGKYYCDMTTQDKQNDPYNIASWPEFSEYMSKGEQDSVAKNWKSGINGAQKIVKLDNGSYLAIQKGIVKYSFFVTANETYYLFSNFSKLGFCGANFVPSATVKPTNDVDHNITLSDEIAYPTPIKVTDDSDADKKKYAWKFGDGIKGYVPGFTIPLFNSITLNRTFKKDQWTTLSLPFNLTQTEVEQIFGKGTQIIVFDKAETTPARTNLTFFYHEIQNVLPGYPYLIRPTLVDADGKQMVTKSESADYAPTYTITKDGDKLTLTKFTVYNKAINPAIKPHEFKSGGYTAKCTPSYCTANENGNYSKRYEEGDIFVSEGNGTVYISEGKSYGKGYRSYIDKDKTGTTTATAKALSISFSGVEDGDDNGTTTDIRIAELADDVIETLGIGGVYNLNGQKVADTTRNLPAGIYIVNGRKVVVK